MFNTPCTTGFPDSRGFACTLTDDQGPWEAELTIDHGVHEYALIDRNFADDNCFPVFELKEPYVSAFDGGMGSEIITHATRLLLDLCGHEEEVTMPVTRISHLGCHVILGTPWLQQHEFCLQTDFEFAYCLEGDSNEEILTPKTAEDLALRNVINRVRRLSAVEGSGNAPGESPLVSDELRDKNDPVGDAYSLRPHAVLDQQDDNLDPESITEQEQRDLDRTEVFDILTRSNGRPLPILRLSVYMPPDLVPASIHLVRPEKGVIRPAYGTPPDPIPSPGHAPAHICLGPDPVPAPDIGPSLAPIPAPAHLPPDLPPDPALAPAHSLALNLSPLPDPSPEPGPLLDWNSLPDSSFDPDIDSGSLSVLDFDPGLNSDSVPDPSSILNPLPCFTATPDLLLVRDSVPNSLLGSQSLLIPPLALEPGSGFLSDLASPLGPMSCSDLLVPARSLVLDPCLNLNIKSVSSLDQDPALDPSSDLGPGGPTCDSLPDVDLSSALSSRFDPWPDPPFVLIRLPGFPPGLGPAPNLLLTFDRGSHAPLDLSLGLDLLFILNPVSDFLLALGFAYGFLHGSSFNLDPLSCFRPVFYFSPVFHRYSLGPGPPRLPDLDSTPAFSLGLDSVFDRLLTSVLNPGFSFNSDPVRSDSVPDPFLGLGYYFMSDHVYQHTIENFFSSLTASFGIQMPVSGDLDFRLVRAKSLALDLVSLPLGPLSSERCCFCGGLFFSDPGVRGQDALRDKKQPKLRYFHPVRRKHHCQGPALLTLRDESLQGSGIICTFEQASRDFGHWGGLMSRIWLIRSLRSLCAANPSQCHEHGSARIDTGYQGSIRRNMRHITTQVSTDQYSMVRPRVIIFDAYGMMSRTSVVTNVTTATSRNDARKDARSGIGLRCKITAYDCRHLFLCFVHLLAHVVMRLCFPLFLCICSLTVQVMCTGYVMNLDRHAPNVTNMAHTESGISLFFVAFLSCSICTAFDYGVRLTAFD
jgi:hypothetical protein